MRKLALGVQTVVFRILPKSWQQRDNELTLSARRLLIRLAVGLVALICGLLGLGLLDSTNWRDVVSGAVLAWSVSVILWALSSYGQASESVSVELRRVAEVDLLHARLNHISRALGAPSVDLDSDLEQITAAREERLAHYAGIEEFRPVASERGARFWDQTAMGTGEGLS